jgi:hypothetical protein
MLVSGEKIINLGGVGIMDDHSCLQFFLEPQHSYHRRYEALRAIIVSREPLARVAKRYGYKVSALKSMTCRFRAACRRGTVPPFFSQTGEEDLPVNAVARTNMVPSCRRSRIASY